MSTTSRIPTRSPVGPRITPGRSVRECGNSVAGCRSSQHDSSVWRHGVVIADKSARLSSLIGDQVVRPAKADWLIQQLSVNVKRSLCVAEWDGTADQISRIGEIRIARGIANHGNVFVRRLLPKTGRQKPVVL